MLIASNEGRQLKKRLVGNGNVRGAGLAIEEVISSLQESGIFNNREAVRSMLNKNGSLDLEYYTLYSLWIKGGRYVISIMELRDKESYYVMHYCEPEPILHDL